MKILYWTPLFWPEPGGIEVRAAQTVPIMRDRGHELVVVASHGTVSQPDLTEYAGIPVHRFPFWTALSTRSPQLIFQIRREVAALMADFKPELLHINFSGYMAYFQVLAARTRAVPTVISLSASLADCDTRANTLLHEMFGGADWIVAVSEAMLADARRVVPEVAGRSSVIRLCTAAPTVAPRPLPLEKPRVMCLGRLSKEKGFDLAVTAFALLRDRYPQLSLTLVGDGPERGTLERMTRELGLAGAVDFTGSVPRDEVAARLNLATVVAIPSRCREASSLVAAEAAHMGRPIVAADVGGLPEAVVHQETGLLVPEEDPRAIAEAIAFLLDHPDQARRMGEAGRQRALDLFDFTGSLDKLDAVYRAVAQRRAAAAECQT